MTEPRKVTRGQLERYQRYARVFGTDDGKLVLDELRRDCSSGGCYVPGDHYATLYKSALRDAVDWIEDMVERAEGPIEIEED